MGLRDFQGLYTNGGSLSILTALKCARDQVVEREKGITKKVIIYISEETHYSVIRAWDILGGGINNVIKFNVDNLKDLERSIRVEEKRGTCIAAIVCNFGSTNSGEIEPLEKIINIAKKSKVWVHIDASYGGPLLMIDNGKNIGNFFNWLIHLI